MKYLKSYNESLGINRNLEEQVDDYIKVITESSLNQFDFVFKSKSWNTETNSYREYPFKLVIKDFKKKDGFTQFGELHITSGDVKMFLNKKDNKATLLHELKHLDYWINLYPNLDIDKHNIFEKAHDSLNVFRKKSKYFFYYYDPNEFQSKLHGYYVDLDKYIWKYLHEKLSDNITRSELKSLIDEFFKTCNDGTYSYWIYKKDFKFSDFLSKSEIKQVFSELFPSNLDNLPGEKIFKYIKSYLNLYTKGEKDDIERLVRKFEKEIDRRKAVYRSKFYKLYQIMYDKYLKKDYFNNFINRSDKHLHRTFPSITANMPREN